MDYPLSLPTYEQTKNIPLPTSPFDPHTPDISTTYTLPYHDSPVSKARSSIYALKDKLLATIKEKRAKSTPNLIYQKEKRYAAPHTPLWVLRRLKETKVTAETTLRNWIHSRRTAEVTEETIRSINALPESKAISAIEELKECKKYVVGSKGRQFDFKVQVLTVDDRRTFAAKALIDSGCTGCNVDSDFVKRNQFNVRKLPRPIPVYNADGTLNEQQVSEIITLEMKIGDHNEQLDFGVTKLRGYDIFIGHDWLKKHNPSIDWAEGTLMFDRCPSSCNARIFDLVDEPEDEEIPERSDDDVFIAGEDRLLMVDMTRPETIIQPEIIRATATISQQMSEHIEAQ